MPVQIERTIADAPTRPAADRLRAGKTHAPAANFERLRAPFSLRCGAVLIDYIVLVGILAGATLLARITGDGGWATTTLLLVAYVTVAAAALLNFVVLAAINGRTLGKWITGLHIERRDGTSLGFGGTLVRHVLGYILTLATFGVGFLLAAFNAEGRALHDLLAGTVVVRDRGITRG